MVYIVQKQIFLLFMCTHNAHMGVCVWDEQIKTRIQQVMIMVACDGEREQWGFQL